MPAASPPAATLPPLRLYLLGSVRLEGEHERIQLPTRKLESLLAYLALHPAPYAREHIASLFWGDSTDEDARRSLRVALTALRKQLGAALFLPDQVNLQLNPSYPLWVDAKEFQILDFKFQIGESDQSEVLNLKSKIDLYRGDLLADFYDDWIIAEREAYRALYLDMLLRLTQEMRANSEYERAIEYAQKLLASDPANEHAHQHLMFCYLATGNRGAALKQYDECKQRLREELGVEPSPETIALYQRIKHESATRKSQAAALTNLPVPLTSFVGRQQEIAEVKRLLETARLLTLMGAGGSGKTRLAIAVGASLADAHATGDHTMGDREGRPYPDGVWWVELAALTDEALVPQAVAKALGVQEKQNELLAQTLVNYLRPRRMLLVLDNCEHLITACAQVAETLLRQCPNLQMLATSRELLGIPGESVWQVPTLSLPPVKFAARRDLAQSEAVQLFVERARAARTDFALNEQNAPFIVQICRRLDGIPLALELAAARIRSLSLEQIAARLDDRFRLLTSGARTAPSRHQTLHAAIDWSYDLLWRSERVLLRRLSVFAGGWTLEAAESVCSRQNAESVEGTLPTADRILPTDVLDLLALLVDKSLVLMQGADSDARYHMLESIRQYAHERLLESEELTQVRDRHLAFCLQWAETAEPQLHGVEEVQWLERFELEHDNLRAVLGWSQEAENAEAGLRLSGALWRFWETRGYFAEGRRWLEQMLSVTKDSNLTAYRAKAFSGAGTLAYRQADYGRATELHETALALYQQLEDKLGMAFSLNNLGVQALVQGEFSRAQSLFEKGLPLAQEIQDQWLMVMMLQNLGNLIIIQNQVSATQHQDDPVPAPFGAGQPVQAAAQGDYRRAEHFFEESLSIARAIGDKRLTAMGLQALGDIARQQGDDERALALFTEARPLYQEVGDKQMIANFLSSRAMILRQLGQYAEAIAAFKEGLRIFHELVDKAGIAECLEELAIVAQLQGLNTQAARLFGAAETLRTTIHSPSGFSDRASYERSVAELRTQMDADALAVAWAAGQAMPLEQAIAEAQRVTVAKPPVAAAPVPIQPEPRAARRIPATQDMGKPAQRVELTGREVEILRLVADGLGDVQVAEKLVISRRTVSTHLSAIYGKLGVKSRNEATRVARAQRLI